MNGPYGTEAEARVDTYLSTNTMTGPFETEAQARETPAVQAVWRAFDAAPGVGRMAPHNHRMLCESLAAAGVELGAYDHRIVAWLAGWEPATCAVVAGLVSRAYAAGAERAGAVCETCGASGAGEALDRSVWTALADGAKTVRWLCADRRACTGRRFPELATMLGDGDQR